MVLVIRHDLAQFAERWPEADNIKSNYRTRYTVSLKRKHSCR